MAKNTVMVVDDSRITRAMIKNILDESSFLVCAEAQTCAQAVEQFSQTRPKLVTMDMNLPDADGIECSRRLKEIDPQVRIVMISAMKDAKLMIQGREAGISSFLQKPLKENDLVNTLRMLSVDKDEQEQAFFDTYVKSFEKAIRKTLFGMLGVHSEITSRVDDEKFLDINGVAVILGLTGNPMGRIIIYMDKDTMYKFARAMLGIREADELEEDEAGDAVEEAANILSGRGVSAINDILRDREMRVTPPGTICGNNIRIANPKLISFEIKATTSLGDVYMNLGFAGGI